VEKTNQGEEEEEDNFGSIKEELARFWHFQNSSVPKQCNIIHSCSLMFPHLEANDYKPFGAIPLLILAFRQPFDFFSF
jgi:hypothetical protein